MRKIFLFLISMVCAMSTSAQTKNKLGLLLLDSYDKDESHTRVARVELEKLALYDIIDQYDIEFMLRNSNLDTKNCFGKLCLVEVGRAIKADKMFSGSIESFSDRMVVSLRLVDVARGEIEKTITMEFFHYPQELSRMLEVAIKRLHGVEVDAALVSQIVMPEGAANVGKPPVVERLKLNGPRMGFTYFTGSLSDRIMESTETGGFGGYPVMFQFGYQFETQYLNEGNLQALFEFIPMITGVDQGYFIPSFTVLHGLRNNRSGWEFALGPSIQFIPEAYGYFDTSGKWIMTDATQSTAGMTKRIDSRGEAMLRSGFVLAAGKTIRSGRLNVPLNIYVVPNRDGFRYGFSFGFNAKK